jgi:hypothetical protein
MNRRRFLARLAAAGVATSLPGFGQGAASAKLEIDASKVGATIPRDFTGLSYESAQLANPAFFASTNTQLIELFRGLSPSGNLRLGGGSSEFTTYSDADTTGAPPFEVFGPDTSKTVKHGTVTTALALRNLRGFLDATGRRTLRLRLLRRIASSGRGWWRSRSAMSRTRFATAIVRLVMGRRIT